MIAPSARHKDVRRPLSESELRDIRAREDREGSAYSDRDMLLDHIEFMYLLAELSRWTRGKA